MQSALAWLKSQATQATLDGMARVAMKDIKALSKTLGRKLLRSLSMHDEQGANEAFVEGLALIEREAGDERNFVNPTLSLSPVVTN